MPDFIETLAPTFIVDLDLPPRERWKHIVQQRKPAVLHVAVLRPLCWMKCIPTTYSQELAGMAEEMNNVLCKNATATITRITYSDLVLFNIALDFLARCTSVVASTRNGQVHGRTLDWD